MAAIDPMRRARDASATGTFEPASARSDRWLAVFGLCGVLAAVALITATIVGGALRDGYDPVRDAISRLTEAGGRMRSG